MPILAGRLRDRIEIFNELKSTNTYNEREKSYQSAFFVRSETQFVSGNEKIIGQMSYADKITKFKVRYCGAGKFNERQFILWRGDYYNIRSIDPDRNRSYMILTGERAPVDTIKIVP